LDEAMDIDRFKVQKFIKEGKKRLATRLVARVSLPWRCQESTQGPSALKRAYNAFLRIEATQA